MCERQEMSDQWCGVDDEDADEHVVVLRLQEYKGSGCQTHPHKPSVKQTDADLVVVVFADIVNGSCDSH